MIKSGNANLHLSQLTKTMYASFIFSAIIDNWQKIHYTLGHSSCGGNAKILKAQIPLHLTSLSLFLFIQLHDFLTECLGLCSYR